MLHPGPRAGVNHLCPVTCVSSRHVPAGALCFGLDARRCLRHMPRGAPPHVGAPGSKHEPGDENLAGRSLAGSCCLKLHQAHAQGHSLHSHCCRRSLPSNCCTCICIRHLPACTFTGVVYIHVAAHAQQSPITLLHMQVHQAHTCSSTEGAQTSLPEDPPSQAHASILICGCSLHSPCCHSEAWTSAPGLQTAGPRH